MDSYIKLTLAALGPVLASVFFYLMEEKTPFKKLPYLVRQVIIGIIFGGIAVCGTEFGIPMNGAQVNARDAAPLCAGLLFGAPAGIIAGVIGGVERWIAVAWGVGTFTRTACAVSTLVAGIYAGLLRKFVFEDRKPVPLLAMASGVVMEVFHLIMVFATNMEEQIKAAEVIRNCSVPLILANALSVFLADFVLICIARIIKKSEKHEKKIKNHISDAIQRRLVTSFFIAFFVTTLFMYAYQTGMAKNTTQKYLNQMNEEVSSVSAESIALDSTLTEERALADTAQSRHIMENGYVIIAKENGRIEWAPDDIDTDKLVEDVISEKEAEDVMFESTVDDKGVFAMFKKYNDKYIVSVVSAEEVYSTRNTAMYVNTFLEVLVYAALFILVMLCIKGIVVKNVKKLNESLEIITSGNLEKKVAVNSNAEFESISSGINVMVDTLKGYIGAAEEKIAQELEVAKNIQASALPGVFPAFPGRREFDIYALMTPAKEVGGDFYDFYITDGNLLYIAVADVSGKGIPAAMFMMRAKTMLKSLAESGLSVDEVITKGNEGLCDGNDAGMFVTAWMGVVNLGTGELNFVNAGHNPPLLKHKDGTFEYLRTKPGLVLAGLEGIKYKKQTTKLESGDVLFLYTDGVTEATDANVQLFGEERLKNALDNIAITSMEDLCHKVKSEVDAFVGEAPQFDDITMLAIKYDGLVNKTMYFEKAETANIVEITEFVEGTLEKLEYSPKTIMQMNIAVDEIYSNIVKYAYPEASGPVTVNIEEKTSPEGIMLTFTDEGMPYNPLKKEDPDITLSAEERSVGGLGIFMVKKIMDEINYEYKNEKNVLHIFKKK